MMLVIKTNAAQGADVLIKDMGMSVPNSGGSITLVEADELQLATDSLDLIIGATDNAFGALNSTLILNNGTIDIPQADVITFVITLILPTSGPYSVPLRDANGDETVRHKDLRELIHLSSGDGPFEDFASGAYRETLPAANPFPTSIIWWGSASKVDKIVEKTITYSGAFPTTIVWKVYDEDGTTVLVTATDTIAYSGPFETSRTRVIT